MTDSLSPKNQVEYQSSGASSWFPEDGDGVGLLDRLLTKSPTQRIGELEKLIANALASALRLDVTEIRNDQSLVGLGLDSLIGMNLKDKLEGALQTELHSWGVEVDPTVRGLARVASDSLDLHLDRQNQGLVNRSTGTRQIRRRRQRSGVVALGGAHGPNSPLFCLHPVGGDLRCYDKLARHLVSRPIYGIRSRGLDPYSEPHQSMEQMIGDYALEIQKTTREESICLLGWSTGGIFARELAIRMTELGKRVESLVMIDTPLPTVFDEVDLSDNAKFLSDLVTFTNYFAGNAMQIDTAALEGLTEDRSLKRVLELGIRNGVLPSHATTHFLDRLIAVCKQHVKILQNYSPVDSSIQSILIRPDDSTVLCQAAGRQLPSDLGWNCFGVTSLYHVAGHHFTMMTAEHAKALAEKVEHVLT